MKHNQDRRYYIQKPQEKKTSTTKTRATHNQHNEDRRYNIPLNLLLVATGCKVHCGRLGALWVARCIVGSWVFRDKMWRMYCSDTRVGEWKLAGPILHRIRSDVGEGGRRARTSVGSFFFNNAGILMDN